MQARTSAAESPTFKKPRRRATMPPAAADDSVAAARFPMEEIAHYPLPGYVAPSSISFSPDDRLICYLFSPDANLYRSVFAFDLAARRQDLVFSPPGGGLDETNLSAEEKLRRERTRERGLGVTRYEWRARSAGRNKHSVMIPLPSGVFLQDFAGSEPELKLSSDGGSPIIDPHLSPDGNKLAFVRDDELHVLNLSGGEPVQLTFGARGTGKTRGLAEYIAQEEMERKSGFWWSPDSKHIAFTEVDSSDIPLYRIMHQGKDSVGPDAQEDHAYPFAGASNVKVRIGVVSISGGELTWLDLFCGAQDDGEDEYLARVNWMPEKTLMVQVLKRNHSTLKVLKFDIRTGKKELVLQEENHIWVTLHDCLTPLDKGVTKFSGGFIWASERTGFRHLYLYDKNGVCLGPLTQGDWMVDHISAVNENGGVIYFTGTMDGPLETNLYCTTLFPDWSLPLQPPRRLTHGNGRHAVILDHQMQRFVDVHDSLHTQPRVLLCSLHDGSLIMPLYEQPITIPRFKKLELSPPEIVQISAKDGTVLYGALYKPDISRFGPPPYKTLVSVYGGPSVQIVCDSWVNTVDMRAQYLRNKGVLVWKLCLGPPEPPDGPFPPPSCLDCALSKIPTMFFSKICKSTTLVSVSSIYGKLVEKSYLLRLLVRNSTPIILNATCIQCDRFQDSGYHFVRAYSASSLSRLRADENEDLESSGDANHKDASIIKEILKSYDSGSNELDAALEGEMLDITEDLVVQVLRRHRSDWKPALSFFNWAATCQGYAHGPRAYNEMFDILGKMKQFKLMQQMMEEIPKERATSIINNKTFAVMVNRYAAAHKVQEAIDVFYKRRDYGFELDLVGFQILLTSLCRYKHVEEAESLFLKKQRQFPPVIRSRNIILSGWCALGRPLEVKRFWNDIISSKCQPDLYTYGIFINSLTKTGNLESAVKVFASMWEKGCHPDVTICNCIIDALCSSNRIPEALEIFKEMDKPGCLPDVVTYNTLIKHLCNIGKMKNVCELLAEMEQKSCLPNAVTFSYILKTTKNPCEVSEVLQRMEKTGCRLNGDTYNLILNLYVGWKYQKGIKFIWADMEENGFGPDQRSYTIVIHGLHSLGKLDEALQYYTEMRSKGMIPEERTMVLVKAMHLKREESGYQNK